jgi:histidine triad (HIT) family protein
MENCIFCKIVSGDIPSAKVYEDELVYAFRDINPQAPVHVLVVPKKHISSIDDIDRADDLEIAACLRAVKKIAAAENLHEGYRVISNCGPHACQTVPHLHFHILGGCQMNEKMA